MRVAAQVMFQPVAKPDDESPEPAAFHRIRFGKRLGLDREIAAHVHQRSPERACFPPALVGPVDAKHEKHAQDEGDDGIDGGRRIETLSPRRRADENGQRAVAADHQRPVPNAAQCGREADPPGNRRTAPERHRRTISRARSSSRLMQAVTQAVARSTIEEPHERSAMY